MAAWTHSAYWNDEMYAAYQKYVADNAPTYKGYKDRDCADLSTLVLIDFAAEKGLPVTFTDADNVRYISKGSEQIPSNYIRSNKKWTNKYEFIIAVLDRIDAKSLYLRNAEINPKGPEVGDLLLTYSAGWNFYFKSIGGQHHAALVYRVYSPGVSHPLAGRTDISNFPKDPEEALKDGKTEYFRADENGNRGPDKERHIDYLNYRGREKNLAELNYFANVMKLIDQGFYFYKWSKSVFENWADWDGNGSLPLRAK